jgi:hypothetical protein
MHTSGSNHFEDRDRIHWRFLEPEDRRAYVEFHVGDQSFYFAEPEAHLLADLARCASDALAKLSELRKPMSVSLGDVCVHCDKPIRFRPDYGDFEHEDGFTSCDFGVALGQPTKALPKRDAA